MGKEFYRIEVHGIIVIDMFAPTSIYNELHIITNNKISLDEIYTLEHDIGFLTYENKTSKEMISEILSTYVEKY